MSSDPKNILPSWARSIAFVVAHPDDETLWAGGLILSNPDRCWTILSLCRASDPDRAPRFRRVLERLGAIGAMADLDDGPAQTPLSTEIVEGTLRELWSATPADLILTHGPRGEYTRHRRHEEVCRAVVSCWRSGAISVREVWMFAYEDGGRAYLPRGEAGATVRLPLVSDVWNAKFRLITEVYGFAPDSWEARVTPREEAFWKFETPDEATTFAEERMPKE